MLSEEDKQALWNEDFANNWNHLKLIDETIRRCEEKIVKMIDKTDFRVALFNNSCCAHCVETTKDKFKDELKKELARSKNDVQLPSHGSGR